MTRIWLFAAPPANRVSGEHPAGTIVDLCFFQCEHDPIRASI